MFIYHWIVICFLIWIWNMYPQIVVLYTNTNDFAILKKKLKIITSFKHFYVFELHVLKKYRHCHIEDVMYFLKPITFVLHWNPLPVISWMSEHIQKGVSSISIKSIKKTLRKLELGSLWVQWMSGRLPVYKRYMFQLVNLCCR